ncbi:ACL063Wp [Eremothecium gossypii ATCC 10895]|uniref:ACL063Wp n=1 Tax=Eremothecium gossypii (strain ATCC 10895 / CBS 109.51 / FGSC 9923 / NRRL Y-1056) TaxID=284811 RepID=Q75CI2_EREGS|nr:ACL063Wp [Eremothecium gossypii ATCC 10895]AAS51165.2 ACL063Wp [Eremothecium gossypii ATCC 10895]
MVYYAQLSEQQELDLVDKVELRFALAEEDSFERNLDTFLAPLVLKLGSPHGAVRQAVLKTLGYVTGRLGTFKTMKLPVEKLLTQAEQPKLNPDADSTSVRLYSLMFVSKGVERLDTEERWQLVPRVLRGYGTTPAAARPRVFVLLWKLLSDWQAPEPGTRAADEARAAVQVDASVRELWMERFTQLFLLLPVRPTNGKIPRGYSCPGLAAEDVAFFTYNAGVSFDADQLHRVREAIYRFVVDLFAPEDDRMLAQFLVVASVDATALSERAATNLRRIRVPYEDRSFVAYLVGLFMGSKTGGAPPANHKLQEAILSVLNNSILATTLATEVPVLCSIGLNSDFHKLRSLTLTFIQHIAKYNHSSLIQADAHSSGAYSTNIAALIRNNLHNEGWPKLLLNRSTPNFNLSIQQRRSQYETLGEILKKDFSLVKDLSYIEFLIDSLKGDLPDFRPSIQSALSSMAVHLPQLPSASKEKLKKILLQVMMEHPDQCDSPSDQEASMACKYIAIKYCNAAFTFNDADARLINILGTARCNRFDVIEEAHKGLHPYWFRVSQSYAKGLGERRTNAPASDLKEIVFLPFEQLLDTVLKAIKGDNLQAIEECLNTAVRFSIQTIVSNATQGANTVIVQDADWSLRIEKAIDMDKIVLKRVGEAIKGVTSSNYTNFLVLLSNELIKRNSNGQKVSLYKYDDSIFGKALLFFLRNSSPDVIRQLNPIAGSLFSLLDNHRVTNENDLELTANLYAILGAYDYSNLFQEKIADLTASASKQDMQLLLACSYLLPRLVLVDPQSASVLVMATSRLLGLLLEQLQLPSYRKLTYRCLSQVLKFGLLNILPEEERRTHLDRVISNLKLKLTNDEDATALWGYLSLYISSEQDFHTMFRAIEDTHVSKHTEFLFTAGEALTVIVGGWANGWIQQQLDVDISVRELETAFPPRYLSIGLTRLQELCNSSKPAHRRAGCMWLLSVVQYLGSSEEVLSQCREIHMTFMKLLGDRDELVQDSASRGLSIIYELGGSDLQETMVKSLIRSFTDSAATMNMTSGTMTEDTALFEPGLLDTGDGTISTYKDILNLANEVGDPALVYKFMDLAKSSTLWSSRKGIAFGLGAIISKNTLNDMLSKNSQLSQKLVPKLFRYRFDPNENVSRIMQGIWDTLILETASTIKDFYPDIMNELLASMGNKEWRVREAGVNAIVDLIQSSSFEQYGSQIQELWTMTFRVMDDIKDSVREAGLKLAKVLSKSLVATITSEVKQNLVDPDHILEILLPFLLGPKGFNSSAEAVQKFALKTILELIEKAGPVMRKHGPKLVYELALSLSFMEPQVINYLSLNADKYSISAEEIDRQRAQALASSPIMTAIEKIVDMCDDSSVGPLVKTSSKVVRKSVGLPSKVGSARILSLITQKYSLSMNSYSEKLLELCFGCFQDRNHASATAFTLPFAHLFRVTSLDVRVKYATKLSELYFDTILAQLKSVIGVAIGALIKHAPTQFEQCASIFMPLIFLAKHDPDESLSTLYANNWTEASKSSTGTMKLYLEEISNLASASMRSTSFSVRLMCARSICDVVGSVDSSIPNNQVQNLFDVLLESSKGRSWDGKNVVIEALVTLTEKAESFYVGDNFLNNLVKKTLVTEISRNNVSYIRKIIGPYSLYLSHYYNSELAHKLQEAASTVLDSLEDPDNHDLSETESNSGSTWQNRQEVNIKSSKANIEREEKRATVLRQLARAVTTDTQDTDNTLAPFVLDTCLRTLNPTNYIVPTWRTSIATCEVACTMLENFHGTLSDTLINHFILFWKTVYASSSTPETIESVKIQLIRFGAKLRDQDPSFANQIECELRELVLKDKSPVLLAALQATGIQP